MDPHGVGAAMTILTDPDRHEIAPIEGARLTARPRPSNFACKQVMAVTGIVFGLFVLFHMIGNLKAYLGPEDFDDYALWLRHMLERQSRTPGCCGCCGRSCSRVWSRT
jgi:hypothetical protein